MPVPKTFSAPGDSFGHAPEDALRYAVWLLHVSDSLMAARYANDSTNLAAGIRIVQTWKNALREDNLLQLKQCIVSHAFENNVFSFLTTRQGYRKIIIGIEHLYPYDTSWGSNNIEANELTANAVCQRSEILLMRGTIYRPDIESNEGILIDPFASPFYTAEDAPSEELIGAYNADLMRPLTDAPQSIVRRTQITALRDEDLMRDPGDVPNEFKCVSYGVFATYEVQITDPRTMIAGRPLG